MKDILLNDLPELLKLNNGKKVLNANEWQIRRQEIINDAILLEYGGMPPAPDKVEVEFLNYGLGKNAACYRIKCEVNNNFFSFCFMLYKPETKRLNYPVVINGDAMYNTCNETVIEDALKRNFVVVKFNRTELAPDTPDTERKWGINAIWKNLSFSAISAWAWGYHRVVDALMTFDFIDKEHIAITGHSRGGKTVLLAGALDERIRYVNPNGSGAHGGGCWRYIQNNDCECYEDKRSERLSDLFSAVPHWLGNEMRRYIDKEGEIPHDMHFIKALVAPRVLLETNGIGDIWANPKGAYFTHLAAKEVWKLYGKEKNCISVYRSGGHGHTQTDFDALFEVMEYDMCVAVLSNRFYVKPFEFDLS